jgi:exopolysaccharide production protein ExoZ
MSKGVGTRQGPLAGGGRLASVQLLRGLAAWIVVFHHFMQLFFNFECSSWLSCFVATRGGVGVDVFFVISGFVMVTTTHARDTTPWTFAAKRLARIVPAYWLWTVVVAALALGLPHGLVPYASASRGSILESALMSMLFLPYQNPAGYGLFPLLTVGWSLNYEMLFYATFAVSLMWRGLRQLLFVAVVLVLLSSFWPWRFPLSEFLHNKLIWEFLYGGVLGWLQVTRRLPLNSAAGGVAVVVGIALIASFSQQYRAFTWGIGSLLIVFGVLCQERFASRLRHLVRLGDLSYSKYLVHCVVLFVLVDLYRSVDRPDLWPAYLVAVIVATLGLSILSFEFVESRGSAHLQRLLMRSRGA